ncbi:unnamed protein product [Echinostoma caproni]|uniref:Secreted protein n=1 Tax=Echinostoma caproni TaxID=27848 RepID=A0A183BAZ3_9TREM|nr:unnamed protein product [Echinostoma caproni]
MNSNIVKILFITFCVSGVIAAEAQSCKEVVATSEAQSVVVQSNVTGCQYRVTSDSGKTVKVYVNIPIEVSAESGATTTQAAATEATTAQTAAPATEPGKDSGHPKPGDPENGNKDGGGVAGTNDQVPADQKQPEIPNGAGSQQPSDASQQGSPEGGVKEGSASSSGQLLRRARDTSSTEVMVYYILDGVSKSNPSVLLILAFIARLIIDGVCQAHTPYSFRTTKPFKLDEGNHGTLNE